MDDAQLRTIWQQRRPPQACPLSQPLGWLMKRTLARKVRQLSRLAEVWDEVIPAPLREHTALESFQRGVLTAIVDSSAHRFQLTTLLRDGLLGEIQARFRGPLDRIRLVPGQFTAVEMDTRRKYDV